MAPEHDDDKDYGPAIVGQMLGLAVGSYVEHNVTRAELLDLVGDMYDNVTTIRGAFPWADRHAMAVDHAEGAAKHQRDIEALWMAAEPLTVRDVEALCTALGNGKHLCCEEGRHILAEIFGSRHLLQREIHDWAYEKLGHDGRWGTNQGRAEAVFACRDRWLPVAREADPRVN